jgi:hypothetical protein
MVGTMLIQKLNQGNHRFTPRYRTLSELGTVLNWRSTT